jgi:hypothetical protein
MKKLISLALVFFLAGCGAIAPAATPTAAPTATPVVLVQTVMVTVIPTQQPTEVPTDTPAPTQTPEVIVVTATGGASNAPTAAPANTAETNSQITPSATLPANAGGDLFTNLTRSSDHFALRCQPDTITFGVSTSNELVTDVVFYYRIEDRLSVSISGWVLGGNMVSDKRGNFTLDFKSLTVDPDLRSHKAWFDYQFVGLNKGGAAIGRSARIIKQITYTIDCTD